MLKVNARNFNTEAEFHSYVQPLAHPKIDLFIVDLTGITQGMVEGKPHLPEVLDQFAAWMKTEGLLEEGVKSCFVTCGDWDLKTALPRNCDFLKLDYPDYFKRWINIKTCFQSAVGKKGGGMGAMLRDLHLPLDGRHHSGIDDSRNIAKILQELARRDERLRKGLVEPRTLLRHRE